jgi:nucleoside 2-deoxyribosyltransferase
MSRRIYLAGPDVFERDAVEVGKRLKEKCAEHGLEGVYPLDILATQVGPPRAIASSIFFNNVRLIQSCEGVLANVSPFRGPSADVGTAWEVGFAHARGLPIAAYTRSRDSYEQRVVMRDDYPDGYAVESFGLSDNLMLTCSTMTFYDIDEALAWLASACAR